MRGKGMEKELLEKSLKKELTESDLRTRLSVILSHDITDYGLVTTFNARRLEDLLKIDHLELVRAEKQGKIHWLRGIKRDIHSFGCTLNGEFDHLGITEEEALIPISALEIPKRVKSILYRTGCINVLGDLLSEPFSKIERLRGMGEKTLEDLTVCLESIGYPIKTQAPSVADRKKALEENGELLVESVIPSRKTMQALNRTGIYTVDELLERDFDTIPGIGKTYYQEIVTSLKDYISEDKKQEQQRKKTELENLTIERDRLRQRSIELRLEQIEVTEKLRQVEAEIRCKKAGVQYGKK